MGKFIISLDFELMWGVRDHATIQSYGANIRGVHKVLPQILNLFTQYKIHGTFSTVGMLFFENKFEMMANLPQLLPTYTNEKLSPYGDYLNDNVGESYSDDVYHFGWHLLQQIKNTPHQEIGTHTFCHYYCLENGQTVEQFRADLQAAINIATQKNIAIKSIIFPRNQFNESYIEVCKSLGITSYRNNELSWLYNAKSAADDNLFRRAGRLIDAYFNIAGHHCYTDAYMATSFPVNIPSSRFLRPYNPTTSFLDFLRLRRIKNSMTHAAKNNLTYHLWWHPHNFGAHPTESLAFLQQILEHYLYLNKQYSFTSYTMTELATKLTETHHHE